MSGYATLLKIRRLEEECNRLGFMFSHPKHGYNADDLVALKPKDQESLPIYSRDAELFCGTFNELEVWLRGVQWARDYDIMLFGKSHDSKRGHKEEQTRHARLINHIRNVKQNDSK